MARRQGLPKVAESGYRVIGTVDLISFEFCQCKGRQMAPGSSQPPALRKRPAVTMQGASCRKTARSPSEKLGRDLEHKPGEGLVGAAGLEPATR
jgi:hypothetical protein